MEAQTHRSTVPSENRHSLSDPVPKTTRWFLSEELFWKTIASLVWLAGVLVPVLSLYVLFSNFDLWHPIVWISGSLDRIFSLEFTLYVLVVQNVSASLGYTYLSTAKVFPPKHRNKLEVIKFILNPKRLLWICHFLSVSCLLAFLFLQIRMYQAMTYMDKNGIYRLNEKVYFLVLLGKFMGFREGILYFKNKKFCITIPRTQEPLLFRIKSSLAKSLKGTVSDAVKILQLYYVLYYLFGQRPRDISMFLFQLELDQERTAWSSFVYLFDLSLLFDAFSLVITLKLVFKISSSLFQIFISQAYSFPIEATYADEVVQTLKEAVQSPNEILKVLAALDLVKVSQQKSRRRKQLFLLSQPGGKPINWTSICTECLKHLDNLLRRVDDAIKVERAKSSGSKEPLVRTSEEETANSPQELFSMNSPSTGSHMNHGTPLWSPQGSSFGKTSATSRLIRSPKDTPLGNMNPAHGVQEMSERGESQAKIKQRTTRKPWRQFALVEYLLKEDPDAHIDSIGHDLQLTLWIIEGLSSVVAASMTEDQYGIVQRDLNDIVTTLLTLLENTESLTKTRTKNSRHLHKPLIGQSLNNNIQPLVSLKLATETAVYKLTTVFGNHLSFLKLKPTLTKKLENFMEFKQ